MNNAWQETLAVLLGRLPAPSTSFIGYSGALSKDQQRELCAALRTSSFGTGIRLKGCQLGNSGATDLANALAGNRFLEAIELPGNDIGAKGAAAILNLLESNKCITSLDLEDNPCQEENPDLMHRIDSCIERNRMHSRGNSSAETSPLGNIRMQRSRARIMEVSPETPTGVFPSPERSDSKAAKGLAFQSDTDQGSAESEQCSTPSQHSGRKPDLETRVHDLERKQQSQSDLAQKLDDDVEQMHDWQEKFEAHSQQAMQVVQQHEERIRENGEKLADLITWRGSMEMIVSSNSSMIQRQFGDFHGVRDKVLKLDRDLSSLRHLPAAQLQTPTSATRAEYSTATSEQGTPVKPLGEDCSEDIKRLVERVGKYDDNQRELTDQLEEQAGRLGAVMQHFEHCENSHAATKASLLSRLEKLEKVGEISEEDDYRAAAEIRLKSVETAVAAASLISAALEEQIADLQPAAANAASRVELKLSARIDAGVNAQRQIQAQTDAKLAQIQQETSEVLGSAFRSLSELEHKVEDLQHQLAGDKGSNDVRFSHIEQAAVESQQAVAVRLCNVEEQVGTALAAHDSLAEQLATVSSFQAAVDSQICAQKQAGKQSLARFNSMEAQLGAVMSAQNSAAAESMHLKVIHAETYARLDALDTRLESVVGASAADSELQSSLHAFRADVRDQLAGLAAARSSMQDCLDNLKRDLDGRINALGLRGDKAEAFSEAATRDLFQRVTAFEDQANAMKAEVNSATARSYGILEEKVALLSEDTQKKLDILSGKIQGALQQVKELKSRVILDAEQYKTLHANLDSHVTNLSTKLLTQADRADEQVLQIKSTMAGHLGHLEQQLQLLEQQTEQFAQQDKAAAAFRTSVTSKLKELEASCSTAAARNDVQPHASKPAVQSTLDILQAGVVSADNTAQKSVPAAAAIAASSGKATKEAGDRLEKLAKDVDSQGCKTAATNARIELLEMRLRATEQQQPASELLVQIQQRLAALEKLVASAPSLTAVKECQARVRELEEQMQSALASTAVEQKQALAAQKTAADRSAQSLQLAATDQRHANKNFQAATEVRISLLENLVQQLPPEPALAVRRLGIPKSSASMAASATHQPASFSLEDVTEDLLLNEAPPTPCSEADWQAAVDGKLLLQDELMRGLVEELKSFKKHFSKRGENQVADSGHHRSNRPVDSTGVLLPRQP